MSESDLMTGDKAWRSEAIKMIGTILAINSTSAEAVDGDMDDVYALLESKPEAVTARAIIEGAPKPEDGATVEALRAALKAVRHVLTMQGEFDALEAEIAEVRKERDAAEHSLGKLSQMIKAGVSTDDIKKSFEPGYDAGKEAFLVEGTDLARGEFAVQHWLVQMMAWCFHDLLDREGGDNYLELPMRHPDWPDERSFVVTLRWAGSETPAQKTARAEAERDQWRKRAERATPALAEAEVALQTIHSHLSLPPGERDHDDTEQEIYDIAQEALRKIWEGTNGE